MFPEECCVSGRALIVPCLNGRLIVAGIAVTGGVGYLDYAQFPVRRITFDDLAPESREVILVRTFVGDEQDIRLVDGVDCLDGDLFGVAGPDADDSNLHTDLNRLRYSALYNELSMKSSAASALPTRINAVRSMGSLAS